MKKKINTEEIGKLPKNLCAGVKSAGKTMQLTREMKKRMDQGSSMEEVIAEYLPAMDVKKIHDDVEQIKEGVNSFYDSMNEEIDEKWMTQHLHSALVVLDDNKRSAYLSNIIELAPPGSIDEDTRMQVLSINEYANATGPDVDFLISVVEETMAKNAGILRRSSVKAMEKVMHSVPRQLVREIADDGINTAMAYAAASYVMYACGEHPWSSEIKIGGQLPYTVGLIAASNIETSRLMYLHWTKKITLAVLHEKLENLFRAVITLVSENAVRVAAVGIQLMLGSVIAVKAVDLFFYSLALGPWVSIIGASALAVIVSTELVTTQDVVDLLNGTWNLVKTVWNGIWSAWNADTKTEETVSDDLDAEEEDVLWSVEESDQDEWDYVF